jgi:hypothetical protein
MTDIIERLEGLTADGQAGDWMDVVARAERRKAADLRRRALIAAVVVLLLAVPTLALANRLSELLVVSDERSEPPTPWIAGNRVHGLGDLDNRRLAAPLAWNAYSFPFFNTSPAVASPDRRLLLYRANDPPDAFWGSRATPTLRLYNLTSGSDRVVQRRAASFAWRPDGALAYARAAPSGWLHPGGPLGHVFVRPSLSQPAVRWTSERARYTVVAWAGQTLLVGAIAGGSAKPERGEGVYALSGPQQARKLPIGGVVAIDPFGELVFGPMTHDRLSEGALTFRVVRVRDGKVLAELDLPPSAAPRSTYDGPSSTGGSWVGSYIVAAFASAGTELRDALVVLRYDGTLRPVHVFKLEPDSAAESGFASAPNAFHSPRFLDEEASEVVAWAEITERDGRDVFLASVFLHCDRKEKRCRRTDALPGTRRRITGGSEVWQPAVQAFIQNPSRPLPD